MSLYNRPFYLYLIFTLFVSCIGVSLFLNLNNGNFEDIAILVLWVASQVAALLLVYFLLSSCKCGKFLGIIHYSYVPIFIAILYVIIQLLSVVWISEYGNNYQQSFLIFFAIIIVCLVLIISSSCFSYYGRITGVVYMVIWIILFCIVYYNKKYYV
mgnify:CR=1 FL=1